MKKIMFNDRYGLTEAVLSGRKTQTRRIVKMTPIDSQYAYEKNFPMGGRVAPAVIETYSRYQIGEVVAVAQSYKDAGVRFIPEEDEEFGCYDFPAEQTAGWTNKMFVRADLMPHQIRITNVRVERLQEISDEDCMAEGIIKGLIGSKDTHFMTAYYVPGIQSEPHILPQYAYAALIDRISGKGTWDSNPYVFVYDFELVK